ncbi:MAG: gamma-glutamyl-gamma-aminobutyrate hydrolase family protein [Planctomycetota bacterium]
MHAPLIGITVDNLDNTAASGRYELGTGYSRAVADAGGVPVLLPHEVDLVPEFIGRCDALILTGGVDPDTAALPADWPGHAPTHPRARVMDPTRQAFELALLAEWDRAKPDAPLLGVCLGMQLLTLHHGGTLNQYLPDTHPPEVVERHRDNFHPVRVLAENSVLPVSNDPVKSNHQQAIADAGRMRVVATSEDGVIEAVDDPARPFCLGVQWHPERGDGGSISHGLIARLVQSSRPS